MARKYVKKSHPSISSEVIHPIAHEEFSVASSPVKTITIEDRRQGNRHPLDAERTNRDLTILWNSEAVAAEKIMNMKDLEDLRRLRGLATWKDRLGLVKIIDARINKLLSNKST